MNTTTAQQSGPSDSSIAQAFREAYDTLSGRFELAAIYQRAREIDASAPAAAVGGLPAGWWAERAPNGDLLYGDDKTDLVRSSKHSVIGRLIAALIATPAAPVGGFVVVPSGWKFDRAGMEAFVCGPNGGGWFERKGTLWQRTLFDLVDALTVSPAAQSSAKDGVRGELWCLHLQGPDDVHAAPSKAHAQKAADMVNKAFAGVEVQPNAVAAPWPHSEQAHADSVGTFITDWIIPKAQLDAEATTAAGLVDDAMVWRACKAYRPGMDASALGYPTDMVERMRTALEAAIGREVGK